MYITIEQLKDKYSVLDLCNYFGFPRSSYYNWIKNGKPIYKCWDEWLAQTIEDIFYEHKKGYRYITF